MHLKNKSWVEISRKNILNNFSEFKRKLTKRTKIASVVKANAYGHGAKEVTGILKGKTDFFAVDNLKEALELKEIDKETPVLILGYTPKSLLRKTIENDISFAVYNKKALEKISKLNLKKKAKLHFKVETGLNRQGVRGAELVSLIKKAEKDKNMVVEGISMHFANIEDTLDLSFAKNQLDIFKKNTSSIKPFLKRAIKHSAASAAAMVYPKSKMDMIRLGISLYGLWPSKETKLSLKLTNKSFNLKPVMSLKSMVVQVKEIRVGESVGYGRTWYAPRKSKIAVIPVGYSDGYDRKLSNSGRVIIGDSYAPVVGRVAMNMITLDVTDIKDIKQEDEVILLGKSGKLEISVEELADKIGTINYEVVSRINPLIHRKVV